MHEYVIYIDLLWGVEAHQHSAKLQSWSSCSLQTRRENLRTALDDGRVAVKVCFQRDAGAKVTCNMKTLTVVCCSVIRRHC